MAERDQPLGIGSRAKQENRLDVHMQAGERNPGWQRAG